MKKLPPNTSTYVVKKISKFSKEQRRAILEKTDYNMFNFPESMVNIDLLTDSGTCALYQQLWAALMLGDDS